MEKKSRSAGPQGREAGSGKSGSARRKVCVVSAWGCLRTGSRAGEECLGDDFFIFPYRIRNIEPVGAFFPPLFQSFPEKVVRQYPGDSV